MRRASILGILLAGVMAALLIPAVAGASTPSWHTYRISRAGDLATVRCPSSSVCVALTHAGQILTTKNAGAVKPTWKVTAGLKVMGPEEDSEQRSISLALERIRVRHLPELFGLVDGEPVTDTNAELLWPLDPPDAGCKIRAEKAGISGLVCKPTDGREPAVNCARRELT